MNIRWNSGLLIPGYNKGEVEKFTQNFKKSGKSYEVETCTQCGCIYEFTPEDIKTRIVEHPSRGLRLLHYVLCPECGQTHVIGRTLPYEYPELFEDDNLYPMFNNIYKYKREKPYTYYEDINEFWDGENVPDGYCWEPPAIDKYGQHWFSDSNDKNVK